MYAILNGLLSDKKGGIIFECFSIWHFAYVAIIFGAIIATVLILRKKSEKSKKKAADVAVGVATGLYALDFFLMPFAYGEIYVEKLPFHVCTAMCVMCFLSRKVKFWERFKGQFALLGFLSNLIYVLYPAGVMWCQVHPLSYRAVQTLAFHGAMTAYGVFVFAFGEVKLEWKKWYKELIVVSGMTLWAFIGNTLYDGTAGNYSYDANWFFLVYDPLSVIPQSVSPYVMPFIVIATFLAVEMGVYLIYSLSKRILRR